MKIRNFSSEKVLYFKKTGELPSKDMDYFLAADEFFQVGFGYFNQNRLVKEVYLPLKSSDPLKESFALTEILEKKEGFLLRNRYQNRVQSLYTSRDELFYHLARSARFYTTLSAEEGLLDLPFENCLKDGFSLLHFCHEALRGGGKIKSLAIVADPGGNLSRSYEEGAALYEFFKTHTSLPVALHARPLNPADFNRLLCEETLVHFSGHIEEKGLWLGREFYHPAAFSQGLPPLLFLNGCTLNSGLLTAFIRRQAKNIVYFKVNQKDQEINLESLKKFYLGILSGYRVGDSARATLDFRKVRLYGWMTNRFVF